MQGFQNYFAQLLSSRRKSAVKNICLRRLKVKVTHEGQMIKWSEIELVRNITCTIMHCYAPNFEEVEGANWFGRVRLSIQQPLLLNPLTPPPPPPPHEPNQKYMFFIWILCEINSLTPVPPPPKKFQFIFLVKNKSLTPAPPLTTTTTTTHFFYLRIKIWILPAPPPPEMLFFSF